MEALVSVQYSVEVLEASGYLHKSKARTAVTDGTRSATVSMSGDSKEHVKHGTAGKSAKGKRFQAITIIIIATN